VVPNDNGVSQAPANHNDMLAVLDVERASKINLGLAATVGLDGPGNASVQHMLPHGNPYIQLRPDAFVTNATTFPPENPFAYPMLDDFDAPAQPAQVQDTEMDNDLAEVQRFPYLYGVMDGDMGLSTAMGLSPMQGSVGSEKG